MFINISVFVSESMLIRVSLGWMVVGEGFVGAGGNNIVVISFPCNPIRHFVFNSLSKFYEPVIYFFLPLWFSSVPKVHVRYSELHSIIVL